VVLKKTGLGKHFLCFPNPAYYMLLMNGSKTQNRPPSCHLTIRTMRINILPEVNRVQRTELVRRLKKGGFDIKPGGKHGKAVHPNNPAKAIPIPNGSQINDYTAKAILKEAGLL